MYASVGRRIRYFRLQKHMTQQQLSEKVGIALSFLGHIERGTRKMSLETFCRIMEALDCSAEELLGTNRTAKENLPLLLVEAAEELQKRI